MFFIISVSGDSQLSGCLEGKHAWLEVGLERSGVFANDSTAVLNDSLNKAISPIISLNQKSGNFVNLKKTYD